MKKQGDKRKFLIEKKMWIGFFLIFPIMFFGGVLKEGFLYNFFGILAVVGAFILIANFIRLIKHEKNKKIKGKKQR